MRGVSSELDPGNPDCLRTFVTLLFFERQLVAEVKLIELHIHKFVGVEEEILLASFDLDESEALFGEAGNDSLLLHVVLPVVHLITELSGDSTIKCRRPKRVVRLIHTNFCAAIDLYIITLLGEICQSFSAVS